MTRVAAVLASVIFFSSCVSNKKHTELDTKYESLTDLYNKNLGTLSQTQRELDAAQNKLQLAEDNMEYFKSQNSDLVKNIGDMTTLSKKGAENLEKSLAQINEKDMRITKLSEAMTRKDSVTIALVTSIKGAIGDLHDEDIQVSVEKGVVFVNISDKFLFRSGSYNLNSKAKDVIAKVAKILVDKPNFEVLIEGHTDNISYRKGELLDNWDLSVKRSTALVRMLQNDFNIAPERLMAAGRGEFIPLSSNESKEGRAANRRTRVVILPSMTQFYGMIEEELGESPEAETPVEVAPEKE
ncbi:MAG: chemotaxis protein MotB [Flavobacteriales bacterium]|jgi:chemotaxis protein MotB